MIPASLLGRVRRHLRAGGVIAYATESCYGLGCDPENYAAVRLLLKIKRRRQSRGLILVAGRLNQLKRHVASLPKRDDLRKFWPGPYTLLLNASRFAPKWITGKHGKIAVRLTAHPDAAKLCNSLNMALVSTSANVSGMKPAKTYRDCISRFGNRILTIPGKIGKRKTPSTIMDMETGKIFRP